MIVRESKKSQKSCAIYILQILTSGVPAAASGEDGAGTGGRGEYPHDPVVLIPEYPHCGRAALLCVDASGTMAVYDEIEQ